MKKIQIGIRATLAVFLMQLVAHASTYNSVVFSDDFNGDTLGAGWGPDRYAPAGVDVSDGTLNLSVRNSDSAANRPPAYSDMFYNTQGIKHSVDVNGNWSVSSQILIDSAFTSGNNLRRADMWARTGLDGTEAGANYPVMGFRRFDPSDPFNNGAADISTVLRVWDGDMVNGWVNIMAPVTEGWHQMTMSFNGTAINYYYDNVSVYTDFTVNPFASRLTDVFLELYNFGDTPFGAGDVPGPTGYNVSFDNFAVSYGTVHNAPEAGSTAAFMAAGVSALAFFKRKRS